MNDTEDDLNQKTNEERLGDYLKSAREELELSLVDVSNETKIRKFYLECFESNDLTPLPADVIARGFLKAVAIFLKLDPNVVLKKYDEEKGIFELVDDTMSDSTFRPSLKNERRKLLNSFYLAILLMLFFVISHIFLS
ncbi:MAG: helix-turn-helix domain-containing protein [Nitrospinota bacterium]|nr:helix-turn-helix domain-containing protein [Nitrospinota bacterium]